MSGISGSASSSGHAGAAVSERRSRIRSAVVWESLGSLLGPDASAEPVDALDIGGGTGVSAVRLAEWGHRVTVVDPSPDALASLARRADEAEVTVRGLQGELSSLLEVVPPASADVVLCHGVLELAADPADALSAIRQVLRPGGRLSLLVAQRHALVLARAISGHFHQAHELLEGGTVPSGRGGGQVRRFTHDEMLQLLDGAGLAVDEVHGVRVFSDLVPGSLLDLEPGSSEALLDLEHAVSRRPEYFAMAAQLHLLAHA